MIMHRRAAASCLAAASTSAATGGGGGGIAAAPGAGTSSLAPMLSQAISTATGPGRPDSMWAKAALMTSGASAGRSILAVHLTKDLRVASWSGSSCKWPRPLAMKAVGTWPVMQRTGVLQANAVAKAAVVLSSPGPGTTA